MGRARGQGQGEPGQARQQPATMRNSRPSGNHAATTPGSNVRPRRRPLSAATSCHIPVLPRALWLLVRRAQVAPALGVVQQHQIHTLALQVLLRLSKHLRQPRGPGVGQGRARERRRQGGRERRASGGRPSIRRGPARAQRPQLPARSAAQRSAAHLEGRPVAVVLWVLLAGDEKVLPLDAAAGSNGQSSGRQAGCVGLSKCRCAGSMAQCHSGQSRLRSTARAASQQAAGGARRGS